MKSIFNIALATLAFISTLSFAAAPTSSNSIRVSTVTRTNPVTLDMSGGLVTVGGSYGGTFLVGVGLPVSRTSPVRIGLQSGVMFGSGTGLPVLASVIYRVGDGNVKPFVGGSVGPVIGLSGASTVTIAGQTFQTGASSLMGDGVKLAILLRPGIAFSVADALDMVAEIPMGGLTGVFYIAPSIGVQVKL